MAFWGQTKAGQQIVYTFNSQGTDSTGLEFIHVGYSQL